MRKIISYIAISLDGKIAKENGDISWLDNIPNPERSDFGYSDFYNSLDITLMGRRTYEQVLGFDIEFPYKTTTNYVFSSKNNIKTIKDVHVINEDPISFSKKLKTESGKDIWLVGGGILNSLFLNADLIDEFLIFIMPVILGKGISLFEGDVIEKTFELIKKESYSNGVTMMHYKK